MVDDSKKVAWNASQGIIMEISNRRSYANTHFINGDIRKAMSTLISIKQSVVQSFTEEERTKLNDIENKFSKIAGALTSRTAHSFNITTKQTYSLAFTIAKKLYASYNDLLMDLLDDRGYLIGEQSDSSRMRF